MDETDLPAKCTQTCQDPWFPQTDVDQGGSSGDPCASGEGTAPALGVRMATTSGVAAPTGVGPIRSHRTFEALRRTSLRGRSGPVSVSFIEQPSWSELEVAYSIGRRVGTAVVRNRLRRRLRAIMGEQVTWLPTGAYVIHTGPEGPGLTFEELKVAMSRAIEQATSGRPGVSPTPGQDRSAATR